MSDHSKSGVTSNAIATQDLCYSPSHGFRLNNVNLRVPEGSIFGFLGANGSGKSTTIRILLGMTPADSGAVTVLGRDVPKEIAPVLGDVGYVPERPHLYRNLKVADSMRVHAGFFPGWDWAVANRLVDRFRLNPNQRIKSLSKGEVGKLLVLQAISQRPRLLILDEPTDGLDPVVRRDLYEAIVDYVATAGATVLLSSHLVHELERVCDRIAVIDEGSIVEQGPLDRFRNGIRSLRIPAPFTPGPELPFRVLRRDATGRADEELWLVTGWSDAMTEVVQARSKSNGPAIAEITSFDLETGFVELLKASRTSWEDLEVEDSEAKDLARVEG